MSNEELFDLVKDEHYVQKIAEAIDQLRRQKDEKWIENLVDSHVWTKSFESIMKE